MNRFRLDSPERKVAALLVVAVVLAVIITFVNSGPDPTADPLAGEPSAATRSSAAGQVPEVPPIEACELLTDPEIEDAMGIADLPFEDRALSTTSGGEQCRWTNSRSDGTVEGLSVQIGPGSPDDFADGAVIEGVPPTPVAGVGALAAWFAYDTYGILSAADASSLGYVFARVLIERQDLDDAGRLDVARQVAATALLRFPGMEVPEDAIPVTTLDPEPPDRAAFGLVGNLLAREAAGDWTRGEGLVATLQLMVGEADADEVLADPDMPFVEGTGIIHMANDYLLEGTDEEAQEAITQLLGRLVFSSEQLDAMAGLVIALQESPAPSPSPSPSPSPAAAIDATLAVAINDPARQPPLTDAAEDCTQFFYYYAPVPGVGPCLEWRSDHLGDLDTEYYRIFVPAPGYPQGGWTNRHYQLAAAAMVRTVDEYEELGDLPQINLVFTVLPQPGALASATNQGGGKPCGIFVNPNMQPLSTGQFQQTIAHEMGHCFTAHNYTPQSRLGQQVIQWWEEGVAEFLSNVAYPSVNDEWQWRHGLATIERAASIVDRDYDNYTFFQFLASDGNDRDVLRVISALPGCGEARSEMSRDAILDCRSTGESAEQASGLAEYFGLSEKLLEFQERMTDASILDTSAVRQPFEPQADPIRGVGRNVVLLEAFEMGRLHLTVPPGDHACLDYDLTGSGRASWRPGPPGGPRSEHEWEEDLPSSVSGEAVFVTTTMSASASFTLEVTDIVDSPVDCEDSGTSGDRTIDCLTLLCGPSNYFRSPDQLEDSIRELLPDLPR